MADRETLTKVVHEFLNGFPDWSALKTRDVRIYVQMKLNLPDDFFSGDRKNDLLNIVSAYKPQQPSKPANDDVDVNLEGKFKEGRFSKDESSIVMNAGMRYVEEAGIKLADLCSFNKSKGSGDSKHLNFWKEVCSLLPKRKRDVRDYPSSLAI